MPLRLQIGEYLRRAHDRGHVDVVSARVHHAIRRAGIRQSCLFSHRQRIHVGANQDGRTAAVLHHGNDAVASILRIVVLTDALRDVVAELAQT